MDNEKEFDIRFNAFMDRVDKYINNTVGMSYKDLPDFRYVDHFVDGNNAKDTAEKALMNAGFYDNTFKFN